MPDKVRCETCYWFESTNEVTAPDEALCLVEPGLHGTRKDYRCHHHSDIEPVKLPKPQLKCDRCENEAIGVFVGPKKGEWLCEQHFNEEGYIKIGDSLKKWISNDPAR